MGDVVRFALPFRDARLDARGLRGPTSIDGKKMRGVIEIDRWANGPTDVLFMLEDGSTIWASTDDDGRTWRTIARNA